MLTIMPLTAKAVFLKLIKREYKGSVCLCSTGRALVYDLTTTHSFFLFPWQNLNLFASLLKKTNQVLCLEDLSVHYVEEDSTHEAIYDRTCVFIPLKSHFSVNTAKNPSRSRRLCEIIPGYIRGKSLINVRSAITLIRNLLGYALTRNLLDTGRQSFNRKEKIAKVKTTLKERRDILLRSIPH